MSQDRLHVQDPLPDRPASLARTLIARGADPEALLDALFTEAANGARLDRLLLSRGLATEAELHDAQARRFGVPVLNRADHPPGPALGDLVPPALCLGAQASGLIQEGSANGHPH